MADYLTFENIYQTVMKAISDPQYARSDEVKAMINMIYLNEILSCDELYPLYWLLECDDTRKTVKPATITGITKANPAVVTAAAHEFQTGDIGTFYDVVGMTELEKRTVRITKATDDTFSLQDLSNANISSSAFGSVGTGGTFVYRGSLINSCRRILSANLHGYSKGLEKISYSEIENNAAWMDVSTSRPQRYMHRQAFKSDGTQYDYVQTFKGADAAYNLRIWYEKQPARLAATTDVPYMPHQFHDAIIAGAITRLGENKVQVESGVIWPTIYQMHLDSIKAFNRKWWHDHETELPFKEFMK